DLEESCSSQPRQKEPARDESRRRELAANESLRWHPRLPVAGERRPAKIVAVLLVIAEKVTSLWLKMHLSSPPAACCCCFRVPFRSCGCPSVPELPSIRTSEPPA